MNSKERVRTFLGKGIPDRVPMNFAGNGGIIKRLKDHFKLPENDYEGLLRALDVDFRGLQPAYRGPKLHADLPEKGVVADNWGIHRKWIEHSSGGYWDYCDFPLKDATEDKIASWPMPLPDDFDYSMIPGECERLKEYGVYTGHAGTGDIINSTGMLMTMENALVGLISDDPAMNLLIKRRTEIQLEVVRRTLEAAKGRIDLLHIGEDLGTQIAPMISLDLFRRKIRPVHQRFIDLAKSFSIPVMIHSCGSSSWAFPDFIEMGISVVDTLQPEAKSMSPEFLKNSFGGRLAFHGAVSTAGPLAYGTPEEVRECCRSTLKTLMPGGGYAFAPTHSIQDNTPLENVLAMYEAGRTYGAYR